MLVKVMIVIIEACSSIGVYIPKLCLLNSKYDLETKYDFRPMAPK